MTEDNTESVDKRLIKMVSCLYAECVVHTRKKQIQNDRVDNEQKVTGSLEVKELPLTGPIIFR